MSTRRPFRSTHCAVLAALALLTATATAASGEPQTVTVRGKAARTCAADIAILRVPLRVSSAQAADAVTKFEKLRERVTDAFDIEAVPLESVSEVGFFMRTVNPNMNPQMVFMQGNEQQQPLETETEIGVELDIELVAGDGESLETLAKRAATLMDSLARAGVTGAQTPMNPYIAYAGPGEQLPAIELTTRRLAAVEEELASEAVADARRRAAALAAAAGKSLGEVILIEEVAAEPDKNAWGVAMDATWERPLRLQLVVAVSFELVKAEKKQ